MFEGSDTWTVSEPEVLGYKAAYNLFYASRGDKLQRERLGEERCARYTNGAALCGRLEKMLMAWRTGILDGWKAAKEDLQRGVMPSIEMR